MIKTPSVGPQDVKTCKNSLLAHADHPEHITTWFQSPYVRSMSEFRNGAKALAQYALLHRAEVGI